jgi:hypothetical protein
VKPRLFRESVYVCVLCRLCAGDVQVAYCLRYNARHCFFRRSEFDNAGVRVASRCHTHYIYLWPVRAFYL